jgi:hypothetical protein
MGFVQPSNKPATSTIWITIRRTLRALKWQVITITKDRVLISFIRNYRIGKHARRIRNQTLAKVGTLFCDLGFFSYEVGFIKLVENCTYKSNRSSFNFRPTLDPSCLKPADVLQLTCRKGGEGVRINVCLATKAAPTRV